MKINCENCGSTIDIEKDTTCPGCKAPYDKNKEYLEYKEQKKREELLSFRQKETMTNLTEKITNKFDDHAKHSKIAVFIVIIIALIIAFTAFSTYQSINEKRVEMVKDIDFSEIENKTRNIFKKKEYTEKEIPVVSDKKDGLTVSVDKYSITEGTKEGTNEIAFHISVQNSSTVSKTVVKFNCTVNNVVQRQTYNRDYDTLPGFVDAGLIIEGYKSFIIPADATEVDLIVQGVTLHINLQ